MKKAFVSSLLLIPMMVLAQSDTASTGSDWSTVFTFQNVLIIFAGLYEIAARVYPTTKNWSALSLIYQMINVIIPNNGKDGKKHS